MNPIMMVASITRTLAFTLIIAASLAASCGSFSPTGATHVGFMNHDTVARQVAGGSDPAKPECPEIDEVGRIMLGEIRATAPLPTARTCEYHVQSTAFTGRIVIR